MSTAGGTDARLLVTGATGFIGRQCIAQLRTGKAELHAVSSRHHQTEAGLAWHQADLFDRASVERLLASVRPTHLLHLAWTTEPATYLASADNDRWLQASLHLLRCFAGQGGRRAVIAGSCLEYGPSAAPCVESVTPLAPETRYGQCKVALRQQAMAFCREQGIELAMTHVFHLYGPHENAARFVPSVIRALVEGRPAPCTAGTQLRDYSHVIDVVRAHVALVESSLTGDINVASGAPTTIADLALLIGELCGRRELVQLGAFPSRAGDPDVLVADTTRLFGELGFQPRYSLADGLNHTIDWWRAQLCSQGSLTNPRPAGAGCAKI